VIVLVCLESPAPGRASRTALDLACSLPGNAQIVALSAGGSAASQALELVSRWVRIRRLLHLEDPSLDQADFFTMGMVLAEAARHLEASLVFTGERSDDEGQGLVSAALAHHLRAPRIARVQAVRVSDSADTVEVTLRAGGRLCALACHLPLVLTVPPETSPIAPVDGEARPVETLPFAVLGLDPSRLVPRPDLLGTLVPAPAESLRTMSMDEAAAALARHR